MYMRPHDICMPGSGLSLLVSCLLSRNLKCCQWYNYFFLIKPICHIFFICSSIVGVGNTSVVNTGVWQVFWTFHLISFRYIPSWSILGPRVYFRLLWGLPICFCKGCKYFPQWYADPLLVIYVIVRKCSIQSNLTVFIFVSYKVRFKISFKK